jgi:hypothetical protein
MAVKTLYTQGYDNFWPPESFRDHVTIKNQIINT